MILLIHTVAHKVGINLFSDTFLFSLHISSHFWPLLIDTVLKRGQKIYIFLTAKAEVSSFSTGMFWAIKCEETLFYWQYQDVLLSKGLFILTKKCSCFIEPKSCLTLCLGEKCSTRENVRGRWWNVTEGKVAHNNQGYACLCCSSPLLLYSVSLQEANGS